MKARCLLFLFSLLSTACGQSRQIAEGVVIDHFRYSHYAMFAGPQSQDLDYEVIREPSGVKLIKPHRLHGAVQAFVINPETLDRLLSMVKEHRLLSWNGFDGHDKSIQDGNGFRLEINFSDGRSVRATGVNAYPDGRKNFDAVHRDIMAVIEAAEKTGKQ